MRNTTILAAALLVSACGGGSNGGDDAPQGPAPNQAPTVSSIGDRTLNQDTTDSGVSFTIGDESGAAALTVSVTSSDTALLPSENLVLGGSADARTLSLAPAEGAAGTATVTVGVTDSQALVTRRTFQVTVNRVFASFTGFTNDTMGQGEEELVRPLRGFTLDTDADEQDAPFDSWLQ